MPIHNMRGQNGRFVGNSPRTLDSVFNGYKRRVSETTPDFLLKLERKALEIYCDNTTDHKGTVSQGVNLGLEIYNTTMDSLREYLPARARQADQETEIEVNNWIEMTYEGMLGFDKSSLEHFFQNDTINHRAFLDGVFRPSLKKLKEGLDNISEKRLLDPIFLEDAGKNYLAQRGTELEIEPDAIQTLEDARIIGRKITELELEEQMKKEQMKQEMKKELLQRALAFNYSSN